MTQNTLLIAFAILIPATSLAGTEGMPRMPLIQPKKSFVVPSEEAGEKLLEGRGYGDQEPMVRMMNLMMVGGSGYEGMEMSAMNVSSAADSATQHGGHGAHQSAAPAPSPAEGQTATYDIQAKITPEPPRVGVNTLVISVQRKSTAKPAPGLKLMVEVSMTSMDMGTEKPKVREVSPGKYQAKITFSMAGPWAVKLMLPEGGEKVLSFDVSSGHGD